MDQLEMLWQYQLADIEVDRFEREVRANPNRQKLLKDRDFILEQQSVLKRIEGEVAAMADRLEALQDEVVRLRDVMGELSASVEKNPPADVSALQAATTSAQKLMASITRYEGELAKMQKDAEARDAQQHEARVRAAKRKGEFDKLKETYDAEYKAQQGELEKLKTEAAKAAKGISAEMMERYNTIKQHAMPPLTRLNDDRCGGCNMSLPQAVLHQIRTGSAAVECENCGRIILVK